MIKRNGARLLRRGNGAKLPSDHVVEANDLTRVFLDNSGVRNLNLQIPRGIIFGFIGPSGCGKTTTVRLLTGIYKPTMGEARVLGHDPQRFPASVRARIGYMPQHFILYPDLSVWENLNFAASIYGVGWARRRRMHELLAFVELDQHKSKLARNISGGMQRRLSLAATLVHNPQLIFLDEPTGGIDPVLRRRFWDHFQSLRDTGRTLFVTTQYVGEAAYCDLVGVMVDGQLLLVDTPQGLRRRAFGGAVVNLQTQHRISREILHQMQQLPHLTGAARFTGPRTVQLTVDDAAKAIPALMSFCQERSIEVESLQEYVPPFDDVFVELVKRETAHA